jgi:hypothetical protein
MDEHEAPLEAEEAELEVLDGELVVIDERAPQEPAGNELERPWSLALPALQAAAMAATGFLAGATAMALAKRWAAARQIAQGPLAARTPLPERPFESWPVGATRTYLVSVRLISRSEA